MSEVQDFAQFAQIVEFSYQPSANQFVVRFLDNNSYVLKVEDLPKKLQTRKPQWDQAVKSPDGTAILVPSGSGYKQIPFHIIHARGKQI